MSSTVTADDLDYVEIDRPLVELAINALASAERNALRVVTAESCTGGLIATVLTEAPERIISTELSSATLRSTNARPWGSNRSSSSTAGS